MNVKPEKKLKIFYFAGPGDAIKTYKYWIKGEIYPNEFNIPYSTQFYQISQELNCQAYIVSLGTEEREIISDGQFTVELLPKSKIFNQDSGLFYYFNEMLYGMLLIIKALKFKADVLIGSPKTSFFLIAYILHLFNVKVIPTNGCVLIPKDGKLTKIQQFILKLEVQAYQKYVHSVLCHSEYIKQEIQQLTQDKNRQLIRFISKYPREQFAQINPPDFNLPTFNVLFIGRIETNKGVFLLLDIAKQFLTEEKQNIRFDLCGSGSQLENLKLSVQTAKLESSFICHGFSNRKQLIEILGQSHIVIVPTLSSFCEGYNQVVLEGVLAGRPVITSQVCPAISDVQEAVLEAEIDSLESYKNCLLKLYNDRDLYEQKRNAALSLREKFFDSPEIWQNQLKKVLLEIQAGSS